MMTKERVKHQQRQAEEKEKALVASHRHLAVGQSLQHVDERDRERTNKQTRKWKKEKEASIEEFFRR